MSESTQSSGNSTIAVVSAIYMLILAVLNICGSLALLGLGALGGGLTGAFNQAIEESGGLTGEEAEEVAEALAAAGGASGLVTILGIIGLIVAVAALIMAIGIFMKKPWSYMGTIIVNGVYIVLGIVGILTSGLNPMTLVLMIISAVIIYLFYSNAEVKQILGQA